VPPRVVPYSIILPALYLPVIIIPLLLPAIQRNSNATPRNTSASSNQGRLEQHFAAGAALPLEQPTKFELIFNLTTAKALRFLHLHRRSITLSCWLRLPVSASRTSRRSIAHGRPSEAIQSPIRIPSSL
jgi:hypothetical protein